MDSSHPSSSSRKPPWQLPEQREREGRLSLLTDLVPHKKEGQKMKQSLLRSENLTAPSFQVIVINANMSCHGCRLRVSQLLSKMTELIEMSIDVTKNQVTVKGNVKLERKNEENRNHSQMKCRPVNFQSPTFKPLLLD